MTRTYIQLLVFGALASAGNLLGGFLITRKSAARKERLRYLIALGAGFMLAAVFLEVIPEIAEQWEGRLLIPMALLLAGYLLLQLAEHTIAPHFHFGEEVHTDEMLRSGVATSAVVALSVHTFFDGVAISSGMLTSVRLGLILFLAIFLHKIPEGFTVASIMLSSGRGVRAARNATFLIAGATFAGILTVSMLKPAVIYTLPFSAGVTLYVAASDLIPEVNHGIAHHDGGHDRNGGKLASLLVFAGVALFFIAQQLLHIAIGD
ncbi:MAG: ZIP family metal transporter [Blastocatellales bacterium]